jgi:methylase of polypeptide subunit release factors
LERSAEISRDSSIVDLGTGNGMLLVSLAEAGFTRLLGLDYSATAVALAKAVATKMDLPIRFQVNITTYF